MDEGREGDGRLKGSEGGGDPLGRGRDERWEEGASGNPRTAPGRLPSGV